MIPFERRAEQRFCRHKQNDVIECPRKLTRIIAIRQSLDGVAQFLGVRGQQIRASGHVRRVERGEKIQFGHLRVHDDETIARQLHDEIGFLVVRLHLFAEVAMRAHTRRFHHAAQRFLAPLAARLIRFQNRAELCGFCRERLVGQGERFELLLHLAEGGGLRGFVLLQPLLIRVQLLFERLDQHLDGFLALVQITLRSLL